MIELESWLKAYADRMEAAFGERLVLLGLQGSYRRGRSDRESDIDLVAVLNRVDVEELRRYRALVRELPRGKRPAASSRGRKSCGTGPGGDLYQLAGTCGCWRGERRPCSRLHGSGRAAGGPGRGGGAVSRGLP